MFDGWSLPPRFSGTRWSITYPLQGPVVLPVDGGFAFRNAVAFSLSGVPPLFPDVRFFILTEFFGSGLLDETLEICSRIYIDPVDSLLSHGLSGSAFAPSLFEPGINRDSCPDQGQSQNRKNCVGHERRLGPL